MVPKNMQLGHRRDWKASNKQAGVLFLYFILASLSLISSFFLYFSLSVPASTSSSQLILSKLANWVFVPPFMKPVRIRIEVT